jgi:hypothetical protein
MIFDFRRDYSSVIGDGVPGARQQPNLTIPRALAVSGRPPSAMAFYLLATGVLNVDVTFYGLVETSDDLNAVRDFASVQGRDNVWVPIVATATLTNGAAPLVVSNLTPGRYYLRITGGTATTGTILGAAT